MTVGPLGRLGRWTATHVRVVALAWAALAVALGVFAPRVEQALSGAGWEATGSESVRARDVIQRDFGGLSANALMVVVHADRARAGDPAFRRVVARVQRTLRADHRVSTVVAPQPGRTISRDGRTAVVTAGAAADANAMVRAADDLKDRLSAPPGFQVALTGASGMWSDFNVANLHAMLRSEVISWPVTMAILVLAFGSLVAAGLPLMLTLVGLVAAAGTLELGTHLLAISIWAMNFALMFALALGIDYALFLVVRFRAARSRPGSTTVGAVTETLDTAGKAVAFSGVTVLISLSAVMLVPSPAFRSMALGIMLAVVFVLAATLTLLPAVLAWLGPRVDRYALPWARPRPAGARPSPFARWARQLWRHPGRYGTVAVALLVACAVPVLALRTGMPSIKVVPHGDGSRTGYELVQRAFGAGAPGPLQIVTTARAAPGVAATVSRDPGIAAVAEAVPGRGGRALVQATPRDDPSSRAAGRTIDRVRAVVPAGTLVGGAVVENHDLEAALASRTALVIGVVLALGFLLLLVALRAPLAAAAGVLTNLLGTGAAFGLAKLVFQDGHAQGLLGFESQGFLDAWAPVFFFAMVFAISMDYTVFLMSAAKEHWERTGDPREALVGGLAQSGRVVLAAAAVMVAVFFTFALSGPLPPKEMGVVLGLAVLLDALLVRLLLVPVVLRLLGRWAWALPTWLHRTLPDVRFG